MCYEQFKQRYLSRIVKQSEFTKVLNPFLAGVFDVVSLFTHSQSRIALNY